MARRSTPNARTATIFGVRRAKDQPHHRGHQPTPTLGLPWSMTRPARDLAPDILRGFALLGIALVNAAFFSPDPAYGATGEWLLDPVDQATSFLVWTFAQGKFYLLFSFLFGYSARYVIRDDPARLPLWRSRAWALLAFGLMHVAFLWHGDILFLYGLLAFPLAAVAFRSEAALRRLAITVASVFAALQGLLVLGALLAERSGIDASAFTASTPLEEILRSGTYAASIAGRLELWLGALASGIILQGGYAFAMMLLGLLAARTNALATLPRRALLAWGFGVGLPLQALAAAIAVSNETSAAPSAALNLAAFALNLTTAPLLTAGYVALILHALAARPGAFTWLAQPGRMSLSMYLAQSAVMATVFGPWGLGLFQRVSYTTSVLIAVVTYLALAATLGVAFARAQRGPLEWLLHVWTRGRQTRV